MSSAGPRPDTTPVVRDSHRWWLPDEGEVLSRDPVDLAEGIRLLKQAVVDDSALGGVVWTEDGAVGLTDPNQDAKVLRGFFFLCVRRRWWQFWRPRFCRWVVHVNGYDFSHNGIMWAYVYAHVRRIKVRTAYLWASEELMMFKALEAAGV